MSAEHFKKILTSNKPYLLFGFASIGTSQLLALVFSFTTTYFLTNYLDTGTYGNYQFLLTVIGLMSIFTLTGVNKQILKSKEDILVPKTKQFILYAIPILSIGLAMSGYFYFKGNIELANALLISSLFFPLLTGFTTHRHLLLGRQLFKKLSVSNSLQVIIPSLVIMPLAFTSQNLVSIILAYLISHTLVNIGLFLYTVKTQGLSWGAKAENSRKEVHLSLGQTIFDIGKILDKFLVFSLLGVTSFATYMVALIPVRELLRINQILKSLLMPKFSQYTYTQVRSKVYEKTFIMFVLLSLIALAYIVAAPFLFNLLFPDYQQSIFLTQLMALTLPFTSNFIIYQMFVVFDKTSEIYKINIITTVTSVILLTTLTITLGIVGTIIAKITTNIVRLITMILFSLKDKQ